MRHLLLAALLMAALATQAAAFAASPAGTDYRLGVGDEVRVKVFEWRSATGDVHEWTALDGSYDIGADGAIPLPLLGDLKATGLTPSQLADAISSQLQSRLNLTIRPQASVEISQYRPFYILGDVNKPGEYSYRPGLTVLEAISLAGGRYRINDPGLVLNASGELRVLRLQYNELLARRARLEAELNAANAMTVPPELKSQQNDPVVAQLIQREQSMFAAQRDAETSEMNALNQLKSLLSGEVTALQQKMQNLDQELALRKQEVNNTTALVQRGLAIAPREYELRETELETEGRRMDLDTAALRAKEDIGKADQSIVELRNKTHTQIQSELADVEQKIPETAARIATNTAIADRESTTAPVSGGGAGTDDQPAICLILRKSDGQTTQVKGDETSQVEPGDTIKVLRPSSRGSISLSDAAPVDPPTLVAPPSLVAPPRLLDGAARGQPQEMDRSARR